MIHDSELLRRTQNGDERAFSELFSRHKRIVFRYALRMSGSQEVAEEVVQDVFMQLITGARGYDPSLGPLSSYLYGMARNTLSKRWPEPALVELNDSDLMDDSDPLEGLNRSQQIEAVRSALATLPLVYREVVVLCELEEMDYASAAETLGIAVGTVRSRLHRARKLLMEKMIRSGVKA